MIKRTLWYAFLVLLCCSIGVIVYATNAPRAQVTDTASINSMTPAQMKAVPLTTSSAAVAGVEATESKAPVKVVEEAVSPSHPSTATTDGSMEVVDPVVLEKREAERIYERWLQTGTALEHEKALMERYVFPRRIESPLDDIGGPDSYGYRYVDNLNGDSATYSWIELRGDPAATWLPSTNWTSHDDGYYMTAIPLSFGFPFYGVNRTQFWVSSNGQITFNNGYGYDYYTCVPAAGAGSAVLAFMHDLHLDRGGIPTGANVVGYRDFGSYMVIEYDSIGFYSCTGGSLKFQAILFADGRIKLQYNNVVAPTCANAGTVGIQSAGATPPYLQYRCQNTTEHPITAGRAIWFYIPVSTNDHDYAVNAITSPTGMVPIGSTVTVTATAFNLGSTTESSPINYSFNGGATVTENTVVLAQNQSTSHTFAVTFTAPMTPGDYPLTVWTTLPGDDDPSNNSRTVQVQVRACSDFTVTAPGTWTGTTCGAGDGCALRTGEDHVYEINIPNDGMWVFTLCNAPGGWDTYLFLNTACCGGTTLAVNDDYCGLTSQLTNVVLTAGTYYLDIEPYSSGGCGTYQLDVYEVLPCNLTCPPEAIPEGEPDCGPEYVDATNGGCNSTPNVFGTIADGQTVCGTSGTYLYTGLNYRDTDWYQLEVTELSTITWQGAGQFPILMFIIGAPCPGSILSSATADTCTIATVTANVGPGTYYLWVGPSVFSGVPCGSLYWASVTVDPFTAPPGDRCEDPLVLPIAGTVTGTTVGYNNDYDWACPYTGSTSPDVVYQYIPLYNDAITFNLCESGYDTKLYIYEAGQCGGTPIACNDDQCTDQFGNPFRSQLPCVPMVGGATYYVVVDGYGLSSGDYTLTVDTTGCEPCVATCPPEAIPEGEPECFDEYVDATNGGCNSTPNVFGTIACGQTVCATAGTYMYTGLNYRDTDWYQLEVTEPSVVTWSGYAEFPLLMFIIGAPCPGTILVSASGDSCTPVSVSTTLNPGTYYLWAGPSVFSGISCSAVYYATVTCEPWTPPAGRCCYGDPQEPTCEMLQQVPCEALGGQWDEFLTCDTPCPARPGCPNGNMYSQALWLPDEDWAFSVSDANYTSGSLQLIDNYSGVDSPVGAVRFWGLDLVCCWTACQDPGATYTVTFYNDNAGMPGTAACTYTDLVATVVPLPLSYAGFPLNQYDVMLDPPCTLNAGWVSVQAVGGSTTCWLLWGHSPNGDGLSYSYDGINYTPSAYGDLAFCLATGVCEAPTATTVYMALGDPAHVWVKFNAPVTGDYKIYSSVIKNNDGNPDGGTDPDFVEEVTLEDVPAGAASWTDMAVLAPYKNYVVVQYCQGAQAPTGRCCYGDPMAPQCAVNLYSECGELSGEWTYGLTCDTPCPTCAVDLTLTAPGTVSGNTAGAGDDCTLRVGEDQTVQVVIPTDGAWTFSLCPGFSWDTYLYLSASCCGSALAFNDDFCGLTSEINCFTLTAGTYYIDVEPWSSGSGAWTLNVSACAR